MLALNASSRRVQRRVGGADDSLLDFKLRFDEGGLVELALGKEIHDEQTYRALGGQGYDGYFPAYRRTA